MNSVTLVGRLGRDPELKRTANDSAVCNFSIATKEYGDKTEWHNIVTFAKTAENCARFLARGREVAVSGRLQTRSWEDNASGKKMYRTEIVAANVEFIGGRGDAEPQGTPDNYDNADDDIPF